MCMHNAISTFCEHPYVSVCFSSSLSVSMYAYCALHTPLRSAEFEFIMPHMMQHYGKPILPAVPDMVLSAALFLRFVRIKIGIYCRGQAGRHLQTEKGGRQVKEIHQDFMRLKKM